MIQTSTQPVQDTLCHPNYNEMHASRLGKHKEQKCWQLLPESLTMPTDTRAAFALDIKSLIDSGFSVEHPGGTTGRESCHPEREV